MRAVVAAVERETGTPYVFCRPKNRKGRKEYARTLRNRALIDRVIAIAMRIFDFDRDLKELFPSITQPDPIL